MTKNPRRLLSDKQALRQGRFLALALALVAAGLFWTCLAPLGAAAAAPEASRPAAQGSAPAAGLGGNDRLSAWIVDWDMARGLAEWRARPGLFTSVRVFAAVFDERGHPALSPAWAAAIGNDARILFGPTPAFLTVVNDVVAPAGNTLKDPELARRLVSSPQARARHVAELVRLAEARHFAGLEIDYEEVPAAAWPDFSKFVAELYAATAARGLALSVVLQPQSRYLAVPMPDGPDYVLMGYDLFGSHSGPGPKAAPPFLAEQADSLRAIGLLGATALALAAGGFDWTEGKDAKPLDEAEAAGLIARKQLQPGRSAPDGSLVSRYRDAAGKNHEVWHADAATFARLWQAARADGFSRLVLWRLGGNSPALIDWLAARQQ